MYYLVKELLKVNAQLSFLIHQVIYGYKFELRSKVCKKKIKNKGYKHVKLPLILKT